MGHSTTKNKDVTQSSSRIRRIWLLSHQTSHSRCRQSQNCLAVTGGERACSQLAALILLSLPRWDRFREEPEESVGEEAPEAVGRPAPCRGKAVKDGRVHEQPHDVNGLGAVEAGTQRCLLGKAVTIQPAVTARWALSCAASGTRRSSLRAPSRAASTSASDRSAAGTDRGNRIEEGRGVGRRSGRHRPRALEHGHRLVVTGDGDVDRSLQQVGLGREGELDGGH